MKIKISLGQSNVITTLCGIHDWEITWVLSRHDGDAQVIHDPDELSVRMFIVLGEGSHGSLLRGVTSLLNWKDDWS